MTKKQIIKIALYDAIEWEKSVIDSLRDTTDPEYVEVRERSEKLVQEFKRVLKDYQP